MKTTQDVGIAGMGFYYPKTRVNTKQIADEINLPDKVYNNTGIKTIFKPSDDDQSTTMAYNASLEALKDAKISADEIDLIVVSVFKNDYLNWQMSCWIKEKLNAKNAMTMEVRGGCAAFFQAVEFSVDQIKASSDTNISLIICAERLFGYGWPSFLSSGGQAIILKKESPDFKYIGFETNNYINYHDMAYIPSGGVIEPFNSTTEWKGNDFTENVIVNSEMYLKFIKPMFFEKFSEVSQRLLLKTGRKLEDIDYVITLVQQDNFDQRILNTLGIPSVPTANEFKSELGHFSGADTYILLDKARKNKRIKKGDLILELIVGGVTWCASLIEY